MVGDNLSNGWRSSGFGGYRVKEGFGRVGWTLQRLCWRLQGLHDYRVCDGGAQATCYWTTLELNWIQTTEFPAVDRTTVLWTESAAKSMQISRCCLQGAPGYGTCSWRRWPQRYASGWAPLHEFRWLSRPREEVNIFLRGLLAFTLAIALMHDVGNHSRECDSFQVLNSGILDELRFTSSASGKVADWTSGFPKLELKAFGSQSSFCRYTYVHSRAIADNVTTLFTYSYVWRGTPVPAFVIMAFAPELEHNRNFSPRDFTAAKRCATASGVVEPHNFMCSLAPANFGDNEPELRNQWSMIDCIRFYCLISLHRRVLRMHHKSCSP